MFPDFSRELVLKKLADAFPDPAIAEQALQSLDRYGKGAHATHLQILRRSGGKLWRLRELVQIARHDYRDLSFAGEETDVTRELRKIRELEFKNLQREKPSLKKKAALEKKKAALLKRSRQEWITWLMS